MARPTRLDPTALDGWLSARSGWEGDVTGAVAKRFTFADFSSALAFVVRIGCYAEKHDHHPDLELGYGRCRVAWSTHDARGVTDLDLAAAEATDKIAG
jgi:4a-hydroxytetrahydrobiopterin dehydratase